MVKRSSYTRVTTGSSPVTSTLLVIINMKKYDRETKTWIEEEELDKKLAKKKTCKGGKEHDWILCLPSYVSYKDTALGIEVAEQYYAIEDAREDMNIALDSQLEAIGINSRTYRVGKLLGRRRDYVCSVCLKRK